MLQGKNPNFGHHVPHSQATKNLIREKTLAQIWRGCFSQLKSSCHLAFARLLESNGIRFEEEKVAGCFSFDFYLPDYQVYIEVDGDYWHANPLFFDKGNLNKTQKINVYRDWKKNQFCEESGMILYRFWENDINSNLLNVEQRVREILCKHQKS